MTGSRVPAVGRTLGRVAVLILGAIVGALLAGFISGLIGSPLSVRTQAGQLVIIGSMMVGALVAVGLFGRVFATRSA